MNENALVEGYGERIRRLALFDPLKQLENKRVKDNNDQIVDCMGLGLLSLLFFFENMLMRHHRASVADLAKFLSRQITDVYVLDEKSMEQLARGIVETFRPPTGRKNQRDYFNWETRQKEIVRYSILKASGYDEKANVQHYQLDEDGLELVFATREYYAEFSLSINQLLLRKQLEKGEFISALRQIDEMRMDVSTLSTRIQRIGHDIKCSIVSEETYGRFRDLVGDLNERMDRESEEFKELKYFVSETQERLKYTLQSEKDQIAYALVLEIGKRLAEVHHEHSLLFQEGIKLRTTALRAAEQSLYHVGLSSFNFNDQVTGRILSQPMPLMLLEKVCKPFLYLEHHISWSPLSVFSKQRIEKKDTDLLPNGFMKVDTDCIQETYRDLMAINYRTIMSLFIHFILQQQNESFEKDMVIKVQLSEFIDWMKKQDDWKIQLLNDRSFVDFWLLLRHRSPFSSEYAKGYLGDRGDVALEELEHASKVLAPAFALFGEIFNYLEVKAVKGAIHASSKYSIQEMTIQLVCKEESDE